MARKNSSGRRRSGSERSNCRKRRNSKLKAFAATGLRVGWGMGPTTVIKQMSDLLTHVGAWAPRPEQVATAMLLANDAAIDTYHDHMRAEVLETVSRPHEVEEELAYLGRVLRTE